MHFELLPSGITGSLGACRRLSTDGPSRYARARWRRRLAFSLDLRLFERILVLDFAGCFIIASDSGVAAVLLSALATGSGEQVGH